VLTGVVIAQSRHTDQRLRARVQADAVAATDAMIARWWTRPEGVPIDQRGELAGTRGLTWRTRVVDNPAIAELGARVVRVSVFDAAERSGGQAAQAEAMFVVDLVVRDPEAEALEQQAAEREQRREREPDEEAGGGDA